MLVHSRVTPSSSPVPFYTWVKRDAMIEKCCVQEQKMQCPWPGLKSGSLDLCLPNEFSGKTLTLTEYLSIQVFKCSKIIICLKGNHMTGIQIQQGVKILWLMITKTINKCWPEGPSGLNKEQHIYMYLQYKVEFLLSTASTSIFWALCSVIRTSMRDIHVLGIAGYLWVNYVLQIYM